jgi:carbamoyltransferase
MSAVAQPKAGNKMQLDINYFEDIVFGISLGYNASAAVVGLNGGILFAISEERLTGEKNTKQFPINAIRECIDYVKAKGFSIHTYKFAISGYETLNLRSIRYTPLELIDPADLDEEDIEFLSGEDYVIIGKPTFFEAITHLLSIEYDIPEDRIVLTRIDHHTAHRTAAEYLSGFMKGSPRDLISISYDGFGDGLCATIVNTGTNEVLARKELQHSLALVYQFVTGALGFKEHQHEGKITGLAAYGTPRYVDDFKDIINYDPESMSFYSLYDYVHIDKQDLVVGMNKNIHQFEKFISLKTAVYSLVTNIMQTPSEDEYPDKKTVMADIAASVQQYVEDLVIRWIMDVLAENGYYTNENSSGRSFDMVLSGGFFANVRVNYALFTHTSPVRLFVLPPMGDEGTAIGAAISLLILNNGRSNIYSERMEVQDMYLGKTFYRSMSSVTAENALEKARSRNNTLGKYMAVDLSENDDVDLSLAMIIPKLLANKKIVCISRGPSEFGPRALGNHSILFDASDRKTNDWLNKRLGRTEFMPFAPIVLDRFKDDLFMDTIGLEKTMKFMTIAVPTTEEFKRDYQAACHIDGTARPQIISMHDNLLLYRILEQYYVLTGKKALINTSFNLHNSPIIHDDSVAVSSFLKADLDALLLEKVLLCKLDEKGAPTE